MARASSTGSFSDALLRGKVLDPEALKKAEDESREVGVALEKYLVEKKLAPQVDILRAIAVYLGMSPITLAHFVPDAHLIEALPKELLLKHQVVPMAKTGKLLTVALGDPFNIMAVDELHMVTGLDITPLVATEEEVRNVLSRALADEAGALNMEDIMKDADGDHAGDLEMAGKEEADAQSIEDMRESAEDGPVIRMVNMILVEAVKLGANDIHIEPQEDIVRLRYRLDGILLERPSLPKSLQSAIISRVKILADLDIGESRIPQDGRFRISTMGKAIDVRVNILPTIFGGKVVMRTLDKSALFPNLAALGLDEVAYKAMSYAIAQPHGIILVTGPTGCGKTTTLYSCLQELNHIDVNVVTCEDPVEYQIPGIIQVRINEASGCTFAASLRAILRQDPDIVLIGEIRDGETAEIAIKAALTGHLVLTTLHANDAAGTITRLLDMGMEPFLLASSVILAQSQRLYRRLCTVCKKQAPVPAALISEYKLDPAMFEGRQVFSAVGCPKCHNVGYHGRAAIMEVLPVDDDIRSVIMRQAMADEIREVAQKRGMITLREGVLAKVLQGDTSLEVALKITRGD